MRLQWHYVFDLFKIKNPFNRDEIITIGAQTFNLQRLGLDSLKRTQTITTNALIPCLH